MRDDRRPRRAGGRRRQRFAARRPSPARPTARPGQGASALISVVTVVGAVRAVVAGHRTWAGSSRCSCRRRRRSSSSSSTSRTAASAARTLLEHSLWQPVSASSRPSLLACLTAIPIGIAMGVSRVVARHLRSADRVLPAAAAARLPAADHHLVRHRRAAKVLLIYLACFAPLALAARAGVRSVARSRSTPPTRWAPRACR